MAADPMGGTPPAVVPAPAPVDWMPHPKVVAGVLAGAITTVGVWALQYFGHITQPPEVVGSEVVIVTFVISYLVPSAAD